MMKLSFFYIVSMLSLVFSILNFLRLMFEKSVYFGDYSVPGWISGIFFILGILMAYWAIKLSKEQE